jgi:hypothetical protein
MNAFREMLAEGHVQKAYQGLMAFFTKLRTHIKDNCPQFEVMRNTYPGYMDMTYFALFPASLKEHGLKISIVFLYDQFNFEVWLSGANRATQADVWTSIKASGYDKFPLASNPRREDYILRHVLVSDPVFDDQQALMDAIEHGTLAFIQDMQQLITRLI